VGENHPHTALTYHNMANLFSRQGDYSHTVEYLTKLHAIYPLMYGEDHNETIYTASRLAKNEGKLEISHVGGDFLSHFI